MLDDLIFFDGQQTVLWICSKIEQTIIFQIFKYAEQHNTISNISVSENTKVEWKFDLKSVIIEALTFDYITKLVLLLPLSTNEMTKQTMMYPEVHFMDYKGCAIRETRIVHFCG